MNSGFEAEKWVDVSIRQKEYYLHNHNDHHEILLFIDGDSEFHVEGNVYKLSPYDIVIASSNELHRIVHKSSHRYERCIVTIDTDFFAKNNCVEYGSIFENKLPGKGNFYSGEFVKNEGIAEIIEKICTYYRLGEILVAKGILYELLYKLKKGTAKEEGESNSKYIRNAIEYINGNLTADFSIKEMADELHISNEHLSRLFKKQMKISVKEYITYKRLLYVRELCKSGKSLLDASMEAGFSNYSNFYRMYVKEFNESPSVMKR